MLGFGCACMDFSRVLSAPQTSSVCKESQGLKWDFAGGSCSGAVWGKELLRNKLQFVLWAPIFFFLRAVISWLVLLLLRFTAVYLFSQLNTTGYNQMLNKLYGWFSTTRQAVVGNKGKIQWLNLISYPCCNLTLTINTSASLHQSNIVYDCELHQLASVPSTKLYQTA